MLHEHIINQLEPPETYADLARSDILHVIPRLRYDDAHRSPSSPQRLVVVGSFHKTEPDYWHYEPAAAIFYQWEEATRGSRRILIAEGDQHLWGLGETPAQAIEQHYSEVGLLCLLAERYNIPLISGEPPNYAEIGQLMLEFPPDKVLLHYGIIQIPLLHRMKGEDKPSLDEFMEGWMFPGYARQLGKLALTLPDSHPLHAFDFSYRNFKNLYKKQFGAEPNAEDPELNEFYLKITSAYLEPASFVNQSIAQIAKRRRQLRYSHLGAVHEDLWVKKRASVFNWRGIYHTLALDGYFEQFGHRDQLPLRDWSAYGRTKSGYLLMPKEGEYEEYESDPWHVRVPPKKSTEQHHLPPHLFDSHILYPDRATAARVRAYFRQRAAEPIGPSPYITHLTEPFAEWKAGFSTLCKQLEEWADVRDSSILQIAHYGHMRGRLDGVHDNPRVGPLLFDKRRLIRDTVHAALLRLSVRFCHKPSEYYQFNQRVLQLFERFAISAQDIQDATVAFDTASKHLTTLSSFPIESAGLTAIERLHYCLEMLEYELSRA